MLLLLIRAEQPKALYLHCAAHVLNLCIVDSCKVPEIQKVMGTLKEIALFFRNSPKRQQCLIDSITANPAKPTQKQKVVDLCKTRWIARHDAFQVFEELVSPVARTLELIADSSGHWGNESVASANGLLKIICGFEFLIAFAIARAIFAHTKGVSVLLQSRSRDIYEEVNTVYSALKDIREDTDSEYNDWYASATSMASSIDP